MCGLPFPAYAGSLSLAGPSPLGQGKRMKYVENKACAQRREAPSMGEDHPLTGKKNQDTSTVPQDFKKESSKNLMGIGRTLSIRITPVFHV